MIAPVGAAIGRPPVNIRSDMKQNVSAVKTISIITGRADAKATFTILNANRISAAADGRAMLAPTMMGCSYSVLA